MSTPDDATRPPVPAAGAERTTGWEKADKVASAGGAVVHGIGWFLMKAWGLVILIASLVLLFGVDNGARWAGLLGGAYGIYLLLPGNKFVIY